MSATFIEIIVFVGFGFFLGIVASILFRIFQARSGREIAEEILRESQIQKQESLESIISNLKSNFGSLSLEALSKTTQEFLKLAQSHLSHEREIQAKEMDGKKGLIDLQLGRMTEELNGVSALVKELEKDRAKKFGELAAQIESASGQTVALTEATRNLKEMLSSSQARGQWGERIAEDILRLSGLIENVNYTKQRAIESIGTKPDFTFFLPKNLTLNMDVKFPLENYTKFMQSKDSQREEYKKLFIRDIKQKIRDISTREYINTKQNTIDCVLLFIPNEQVFGFIQAEEPTLFDLALQNKVVCCSPMTFFAILAVIRQTLDNFSLEKAANEILIHLSSFKRQWEKFIEKFSLLGKKINDTQIEYEQLSTTRRRLLEKPLDKLEEIRIEKGLTLGPAEESENQL